MKSGIVLQHKFVETIPDVIEERTVYVSVRFATAIHKCVCGCGNEVVTPLHPTRWKLTFDGQSISLFPSIGNWDFNCHSHYWIKRNKVLWSRSWSRDEIDAKRKHDDLITQKYFTKPQR